MNNPRKSVHRGDPSSTTGRSVVRAALGAAIVATTFGCGADAKPEGAASAKASAATSASPAASAKNPAAPADPASLADYCKASCERATSCGKDTALSMKGLEPEAKAAIDKSQGDTVRACVDACNAEPATEVRLQLARRCNQEADCKTFAKCLADLGAELKKP